MKMRFHDAGVVHSFAFAQTKDGATRTLTAVFTGPQYEAVRSGENLEILDNSAENGVSRIVARLPGAHFMGERDGNELNIYAIGDESGAPGVDSETGAFSTTDRERFRRDAMARDRAERAGLRAINKRNRAFYEDGR